jgi:hypothetical protein
MATTAISALTDADDISVSISGKNSDFNRGFDSKIYGLGYRQLYIALQ